MTDRRTRLETPMESEGDAHGIGMKQKIGQDKTIVKADRQANIVQMGKEKVHLRREGTGKQTRQHKTTYPRLSQHNINRQYQRQNKRRREPKQCTTKMNAWQKRNTPHAIIKIGEQSVPPKK